MASALVVLAEQAHFAPVSDFLTLAASLADSDAAPVLPVERWNPAHCGRLDLVIRADGVWVHEGTPIGRPALVRLFSRVLRKDPEGYVLVTPAEKMSITVEDVPFVVVDFDWEDDWLTVRTNVGDSVRIVTEQGFAVRPGPDGAEVPYVRIRGELDARFGRNAWYRLVDAATEAANGDFVIKSGPLTLLLGRAS